VPALALLPLWAFVYANTLEKPSAATAGPLAAGAQIFDGKGCAGCHGSAGGGGAGPSFLNGELSKSWPKFQDQIRWVSLGSNGWPGTTYGAQNKPKLGGMPAWASELTPLQIAQVVRYEREVLASLPPEPDLVAITEGTKPPLDKDGNPVAAGA
jgi:mono/diheme cytochrome c family protein